MCVHAFFWVESIFMGQTKLFLALLNSSHAAFVWSFSAVVYLNTLPASALIASANSLDPDQALQGYPVPNCLL